MSICLFHMKLKNSFKDKRVVVSFGAGESKVAFDFYDTMVFVSHSLLNYECTINLGPSISSVMFTSRVYPYKDASLILVGVRRP